MELTVGMFDRVELSVRFMRMTDVMGGVVHVRHAWKKEIIW